MEGLQGAVGNWVSGEKFWGREDEIEQLIELLDDGHHVLIAAQRRIGKTSLMREAGNRLFDRYLCLHLDLQEDNTPADVVAKIGLAAHPHSKLWEKTQGVFRNIFQSIGQKVDTISLGELGINLRKDMPGDSWQHKGSQIMSILAGHDKPVVLFIDELPILINRLLRTPQSDGKEKADQFLSWLRAQCLEHGGRIRMVISGSIGLEPVMRLAGLSSTINHLFPFHLPPWERTTALGCLKALANYRSINLPPETAGVMLDLLGSAIPYHVQLFFNHINEDFRRSKREEYSIEDIRTIYRENLLGVHGHAELQHMEERLRQMLPAEQYKLALDLLTQAAVAKLLSNAASLAVCARQGLTPEDTIPMLQYVLGLLEHDGYLHRVKNGHVFQSNLLRDWWEDQFGRYHTPVPEGD